jgi:hypothetical protein
VPVLVGARGGGANAREKTRETARERLESADGHYNGVQNDCPLRSPGKGIGEQSQESTTWFT